MAGNNGPNGKLDAKRVADGSRVVEARPAEVVDRKQVCPLFLELSQNLNILNVRLRRLVQFIFGNAQQKRVERDASRGQLEFDRPTVTQEFVNHLWLEHFDRSDEVGAHFSLKLHLRVFR